MSSSTWTPIAVASNAHPWRGSGWRVVETQHVASSMKLVDNASEQDELERLLDASKPRLAAGTERLHYLLAAPFRYQPRRGGSRFRAVDDPGVFYAAQRLRTACLELGYWRWRFLIDAPALDSLAPLPFTAFKTRMDTTCVDLRQPPFDTDVAIWTDPDDYHATQAFARVVRKTEVGVIHYASVRDPRGGLCFALLTPSGFAVSRPVGNTQTWWLRVTRHAASWKRDDVSHEWTAPTSNE